MFSKKLLSKILTIGLIICFLFTSIFMFIQVNNQMINAKSIDHDHGTSGDADYMSFSWQIDNTFTGGTLYTGNYYLTEDIDQINQAIIIAANETVNICLKGHSFKLYADGTDEQYFSLIVNEGATLNIYDCEDNAGKIYLSGVSNGTIDVSGTLNLYNGTIENCSDRDCISLSGAMIVGENASIINTGKGTTLFIDRNEDINIYGTILQNYEGNDKKPCAIFTEKASPRINIYNSTVVKSKKGLDFNLDYDDGDGPCLYVKETLSGTKTFTYHYWAGSTIKDNECLAVKKESTNTNTNAEFKSYFTYVSSTGMYFDQVKTNGDIEIVQYKVTTQPTSDNLKFETNNSNATYEWYKVNYETGTITNSDLEKDTNLITKNGSDEVNAVLSKSLLIFKIQISFLRP